MKKSFIFILIAALGLSLGLMSDFFTNTADARSLSANVKSKRIVAGTRFKMQLLNNVNTKNDSLGADFNSMLLEDIKVSTSIILPRGTALRGSVANYKPPRRLSRGALIYVEFDHIVTTEGKQLPIKAAIGEINNLIWDGGIIANGNYGYALKQNVKKSGEIIKNSTDWGINVVGDKCNGYLKYATAPIAAIGGTIGAGGYLIGDSIADLFKKGEEVVIPAGTKFDVFLEEDLDVPVNY